MKIVNLTPHAINFVGEDGTPILTVDPSGTLARVSVTTETVGEIAGIPVTQSVFGEVVGLPDPEDGTVFVVSSLVAGRCHNRGDVFIPNESVRDSAGRIIGCKSLGKVEGQLDRAALYAKVRWAIALCQHGQSDDAAMELYEVLDLI